ncbi:MAG: ABC transporter permease [Hyphomonadaceae bacterium]|nr:ABC transporter permease [Hyphomonadaceae bacterium]
MPPEIERRLVAKYGLDLPIQEQLARYLGGLVVGDFGPSMTYKDKTVIEIIAEGAPTSAILGLGAMALALLVGGGLGVMAALRQNRLQDYAVMALAIAGVCLPPLVVGPIMQLFFGVQWGLLPSQGLHRDEFGLAYLILPIITLSLPLIAIISRLMRASMIEALRSNAIRTARAKGLSERAVVIRHALRNALIPVVTVIGLDFGAYLTGSILTETIFSWPGIGRYVVMAISRRDLPAVQGSVLFLSVVFVVVNLLTDVAYGQVDPRVRAK